MTCPFQQLVALFYSILFILFQSSVGNCGIRYAILIMQVDRESFPCSCVAEGCRNENGRIEFDSDRVRSHFESIMERLNGSGDGGNLFVLKF